LRNGSFVQDWPEFVDLCSIHDGSLPAAGAAIPA
jgi:hypothetical protein